MIEFLKHLFCRHKHKTWCHRVYKNAPIFFNLSGETQYLVCDDCGKTLEERFIPNQDGS